MDINLPHKGYPINLSKEHIGVNLNGVMQYKIEEILTKCETKNEMELIYYIVSILNEPRQDLIIELYKELDKQFIVSIFEKTLRIENEGGMIKKCSNYLNEKKSLGGVFFSLMKRNEGSKEIIKRILKINYHQRNERKKIYRKFEKLSFTK